MKMENIRTIAKSHSIKPDHLSKTELIKAIQTDEGNFDCFRQCLRRRVRSSRL